jgi:hypothetical protein
MQGVLNDFQGTGYPSRGVGPGMHSTDQPVAYLEVTTPAGTASAAPIINISEAHFTPGIAASEAIVSSEVRIGV